MQNKTKNIIICALFASLTAILAQISIPIPFTPVPINLATLSVCLTGGILGPKWGMISQIVYVALGLIGVPVFSGFTAGLGIILGPTGGYIAGYMVAAFIIGLIYNKNKKDKIYISILAMILGMVGCYTPGIVWFMYVTQNGIIEALLLCIVPFLIGDLFKCTCALVLIRKMKNYYFINALYR